MRQNMVNVLAAAVALAGLTGVAAANIDLELRPADQSAGVGEPVNIELYAVSDSGQNQLLSALQVILTWNDGVLQLDGLDSGGATLLLSSSFPFPDPHGLNEADPPEDGDGFYLALAPLGDPVDATPEGTLITTFQFTAVGSSPLTTVAIVPSGGSPPGQTKVLDGTTPNLDVTGTLGSADVTIAGGSCPADVDNSGVVDVDDLVAVILAWGTADPAADINDDGIVDVDDLVAVVLGWGACP